MGVQLEDAGKAPVIAIQLDLFEDVVALPWYGRSPRSLTRALLALFLRREPEKRERFFAGPEQFVFALTRNKAPRRYRGAPLLVPLDRRINGCPGQEDS